MLQIKPEGPTEIGAAAPQAIKKGNVFKAVKATSLTA